jgi:hypothetical protein
MNLPFLKYKTWLLTLGVLCIILPALLLLYLMMPMPASQEMHSVLLSYFIYNSRPFLLILGMLLITIPTLNIVINGKTGKRIWLFALIIICVGVMVVTKKMSAPQLFKQPASVDFLDASKNQLPPSTLVLGIEQDGMAKAYPLKYLAYHHQVVDKIGDQPLIATYCTMCRTGSVYATTLDNQNLQLDLIGALQYNATFRDRETGSWWRQATGEFIAGPLKGKVLPEIYSEQVTLGSWLQRHPNSLVMQADEKSEGGYHMFGFNNFDTYRDLSLKKPELTELAPRSWVLGIEINRKAKAYPWKEVLSEKVINDIFEKVPVLIMLENDSLSFHGWSRQLSGKTLSFTSSWTDNTIRDNETGSVWNSSGTCTEGELMGQHLHPMQVSQEFWHSWKIFHPETEVYKKKG